MNIDKTQELAKGIEGFPFIFIEGFAACGKSTAVKMYLEKHPELSYRIIDTEREWDELRFEGEDLVILENLNSELTEERGKKLAAFLEEMPSESKVILVGRERPDKHLLPFLWKGQLEIIPQETLLFTKSEIQKLIMEMGCGLSAKEVFEVSGGWPGCVDVMLRLAKRSEQSAKELRSSYEIEGYIQGTIMSALTEKEVELLRLGASSPFINEKICEYVFGILDAKETLERLRRKGILYFDSYRKCWKVAETFRNYRVDETFTYWRELADWYGKAGYIREAISCIKHVGDDDLYIEYLQKYYERIEPLDVPGELLARKRKYSPEICYLQGLYHYMTQEFQGIDREIQRLEKMEFADEHKKHEILLNLYYLKPDCTLAQWMDLLELYGEMHPGQTFRLYHILGYSHTYLCGFRDLTGLFACLKKDENRMARQWRSFLGEAEWQCYQLARIDYYLDTERGDKIPAEDWEVFERENEQVSVENYRVQLYLAGKLMKTDPTAEHEEHFARLCKRVKGLPDEANVSNSVKQLYSRWTKESHLMAYWLRYAEGILREDITEQNYAEICFMMKGYLQLGQFEKVESVFKKMIPYLQKYRRTRILAEILFQQAVVSWELGRRGQALQFAIESFMIGAPCRYVDFYTNYGAVGYQVLEMYEEWCRTNLADKWQRKKKYQYGDVLRMPEVDYVGVILRLAAKKRNVGGVVSGSASGNVPRRMSGNVSGVTAHHEDIVAERLTMMETMVLQAIARGCSNAQICEELNLKLPTVKAHSSSVYKKLGVSGRVQAVNRGKELGLV